MSGADDEWFRGLCTTDRAISAPVSALQVSWCLWCTGCARLSVKEKVRDRPPTFTPVSSSGGAVLCAATKVVLRKKQSFTPG